MPRRQTQPVPWPTGTSRGLWYHPIWAPPSPDELKQGAAALDRAINAKTDRERDYIQALAVFYKDWLTVDHATRAKNYERALAAVCDRMETVSRISAGRIGSMFRWSRHRQIVYGLIWKYFGGSTHCSEDA